MKDFSQTLLDEHDVVVKKVSAQLSREGCFDLLTLEDVGDKTGATLLAGRQLITSTGAPTRSGCACRASVSWRRCLPPG
ncbi:lipoprotein ynfC [Klebsiella pneumoniae]|uniref:Lipoprotein ynfC n=1 Tax=Klebsiella pneumoniae TaxID=573 RepID=A0A2X3EUL3_KLEPN|nr:lipoprotein ynfC [Klebsiella pneumoniae]